MAVNKMPSIPRIEPVKMTQTKPAKQATTTNSEKAATWLRRPSRLFGGKAPLALADTELGGRMVEDVLQRIAHGIAA